MNLIEGLNDKQKDAVLCTDGPLLILAGAGSGKTKTIIHRIAHIIQSNKAKAYEILAITFTNKAAQEMRDRIASMNIPYTQDIWMSTFHSMCAKFLRYHGNAIGYDRNFVIYDAADQKNLVKECLNELNIDEKMFNPSTIISQISSAKEKMIFPEMFLKNSFGDYREEKIGEIYHLYQKKLKNNNAMDFDDLLINSVLLFENNPDILTYYQNKFKYILVDEYQDTNHVQYRLVSLLATKNKNICVCGDDDQSIYGFRGADIRNILEFEEDFPNANIIKLEQNYRSTPNILKAANSVIRNNTGRKSKKMWTENEEGEQIECFKALDERDEAEYISDKIKEIINNSNYKHNSISILYRTNAQSRVFEESFMRKGIPYQIVGGLKFYSRMEIKDIVSYLTLLLNPKDDISFKRIINMPKRGIGASTISKLQEFADFKGWSLFDVVMNIDVMVGITKSVYKKLQGFSDIMKNLQSIVNSSSISELINRVIIDSGYMDMLQEGKVKNSQSRIENLQELVSSAVEFENNSEENTLTAFLENISLIADIDNYSHEGGQILLMTLHNAKGLEFPIVFLPGLEEGIFPHSRSMDNETELEEERRLCYVGITRAREKLYLSYAESRTQYGRKSYNMKSRFFGEIPSELMIEEENEKMNEVQNLNVNNFYKKSIEKQIDNMIQNNTKKSSNIEIIAGIKVNHKKWGIGTVISVSGEGSNKIASIAFPGLGIKKIAVDIAPITLC